MLHNNTYTLTYPHSPIHPHILTLTHNSQLQIIDETNIGHKNTIQSHVLYVYA